jgi:hypothetical protein
MMMISHQHRNLITMQDIATISDINKLQYKALTVSLLLLFYVTNSNILVPVSNVPLSGK